MKKAKHIKPEEIIVPELEALVGTYDGPKPWTEADKAAVRKYYGKVPTKAIAKQIGRTSEAVVTMASKLRKGKN